MTTTAPRTRTLAATIAGALTLTLLLLLAPAATAADTAAESELVRLTNELRARHGLPALTVASDLVAVARRHSDRMAGDGQLRHNANLGSEVSGWTWLGENVGTGGTVSGIHDAFVASSQHYENLVAPEPTEIGIGITADARGRLWVTEVFRRPDGTTSAPASDAPTTEPAAPEPATTEPATTEPAPVPAPAPAPAPTPASAPAPATAPVTATSAIAVTVADATSVTLFIPRPADRALTTLERIES